METAKELFQADCAMVQPHSGADANLLAVMSILAHKFQVPIVKRLGHKTLNDLSEQEFIKLKEELASLVCLGPSLNSGGHLTHGAVRVNLMSRLMRCVSYHVNPETERFDYAEIAKLCQKHKPAILIAGYSAYSRRLNFAKFKEIADQCGAVLWVDMAHFAGFVAGGVFVGEENPVPYADILTTTTHKTLRGPRGGLLLATKEYESVINRACPMMMGGPLPHVIAAKTVALKEAMTVDFKQYTHQVVDNARMLSDLFQKEGIRVLTGGTDNHMLILDLTSLGISGRIAEDVLSSVGIAVNRNSIPSDVVGKWDTSGIRVGTSALTTLGMGTSEMEEVANIIVKVLRNITTSSHSVGNENEVKEGGLPEYILQESRERVSDLLSRFPLYPEIDLESSLM